VQKEGDLDEAEGRKDVVVYRGSELFGSLVDEDGEEWWLEYMNINTGHGFWDDIHTPFVHAFDNYNAFVYIPYIWFDLRFRIFDRSLVSRILIFYSISQC